MSLSGDTTALLVVDMQNGFLDPAGSMARMGMPHENLQSAIGGCERLVAGARAAGIPVIFTRYVYLPGHLDGGLLPTELLPQMREVDALVTGTWDAEIIPALTPQAGEVVIDKSRPSSFYGTQLEPVLTSLGVRQLVIAGVTTNICVETTARDAGQRDYRVHVPADACAEYDVARHDHALTTIGFTFGWVTSVEDVLAHWS